MSIVSVCFYDFVGCLVASRFDTCCNGSFVIANCVLMLVVIPIESHMSDIPALIVGFSDNSVERLVFSATLHSTHNITPILVANCNTCDVHKQYYGTCCNTYHCFANSAVCVLSRMRARRELGHTCFSVFSVSGCCGCWPCFH